MELASCKSQFMTQINISYGSGGMSLALNEAQSVQLIQFLKNTATEPLCIKKAATVVGLQPCKEERHLGVWKRYSVECENEQLY